MKTQLTDEMFSDALFNEDEIGSVIRVHLHIEYYVNKIYIQCSSLMTQDTLIKDNILTNRGAYVT